MRQLLIVATALGLNSACFDKPDCYGDDECGPGLSCVAGVCRSYAGGISRPNWNQHVFPIVQAKCFPCHDDPPVMDAPFGLSDYASVQATGVDGQPIFERMAVRTSSVSNPMPPRGSPGLTNVEFEVILRWVDVGAPEGTEAPDGGVSDGGPTTGPFASASSLSRIAMGVAGGRGQSYDGVTQLLVFSEFDAQRLRSFVFGEAPRTLKQGVSAASLVHGNDAIIFSDPGERALRRFSPPETIEDLARVYQGGRFNGPEGLALGSNGRLYFSDPAANLDGRPAEQAGSAIYSVSEAGVVSRQWQAGPQATPWALAFSVDRRLLYVSDLNLDLVRSFDVDLATGTLSGERIQVVTGDRPRALLVDADGNLFVGAADGVTAYSRQGRVLGRIEAGEAVTALAFGGPSSKTLFVLTATTLSSVLLPNLP